MKIDFDPPDPTRIVQERATHKRYASWNPGRSARDLVALDAGSCQPRTNIDRVRPWQGTQPMFGNVLVEDDNEAGDESAALPPKVSLADKWKRQLNVDAEDRGDA